MIGALHAQNGVFSLFWTKLGYSNCVVYFMIPIPGALVFWAVYCEWVTILVDMDNIKKQLLTECIDFFQVDIYIRLQNINIYK